MISISESKRQLEKDIQNLSIYVRDLESVRIDFIIRLERVTRKRLYIGKPKTPKIIL